MTILLKYMQKVNRVFRPCTASLTPAGLPPLPLGGHRVLHNLDLSNLGGKISQPYRAIEP